MKIVKINHHNNRDKGFTLIELLLYVAIVGSLLLAVVTFSMLALDARIKNQTISEVDQQGVAVIQQIQSAISNANSVNAPVAGNSSTNLSLNMPSSGANPTTFSLSSGVLNISEGSNGGVALTNSKVAVTNLQFTNLSRSGTKGIIKISFTIARVNPAGKNAYDYQKTFTTSMAVRQ